MTRAGPTSPRVRGQSSYWVQYNSGKRSLSVNLRTEEGKEILRNLVKESDMLIQNFRPGTIDKMGFGYETLKALNPGIIMINVSAYGQYGPYHSRVGFDQVGQAISGLMSLNGEPNGRPTLVPFPLIDRITALHATIGALAALHERSRSGEGQAIEVCLADTAYTTVEIPVSTYLGTGEETPRSGNRYGSGDMYETLDGHVYIASYSSNNIFPRFANAIGRPEWATDPGFRPAMDVPNSPMRSSLNLPGGSHREQLNRPQTRWVRPAYRVHPSTTSNPRPPTPI